MDIRTPGSHLDHLLRQTRMHHVQLSSMADLKANILLTTASVVITLSIRHLAEPKLHWPALVLMAFSLLTILLAAYAVMPKLPLRTRQGSHPDTTSPGFNLLFFGDFTRLDYEEFEAAFEKVLNDPSQTYEVQIREIYLLGQFLAKKKYRFVRLAYLAFLTGLLASGAVLLTSLLRA